MQCRSRVGMTSALISQSLEEGSDESRSFRDGFGEDVSPDESEPRLKSGTASESTASSAQEGVCLDDVARMLEQEDGPEEAALSLLQTSLKSIAQLHQDEIADLLFHGDIDTQVAAASAINLLGEKAEEHAEKLISFLEDDDRGLRKAAIRGLGRMGATRAIAPIAAFLAVDKLDVRAEATEALGLIGPFNPGPVVKLLRHHTNVVRHAAADALIKMAKHWAPGVNGLEEDTVEFTNDLADSHETLLGYWSLLRDRVAEVMNDPRPEPRRAAAEVLMHIGESGAIRFDEALDDGDQAREHLLSRAPEALSIFQGLDHDKARTATHAKKRA